MTRQDKKGSALAVRFIRFLVGLTFGVLIPLVILGAGAYGAYTLMRTAPQAERTNGKRGESTARLVEAIEVQAEDQQIVVEAMGLVTPARRVELQPLVDGEIVDLHPHLEQGGFIAAGEAVARIDPLDYELALRQVKAQVAQMESALEIEMGQQEIAREEFELLGEGIPDGEANLVLRKPQFESAKADLERARALLRAAELDLERTRVKAPFNSLVEEESAEIGAIASRNDAIAELVGTDRYWVELSVPVDTLRWIELPGPEGEGGSRVWIYDQAAWGPKAYREGRVIRFAASVDEQSRMATLVVGVEDPLALKPENQDQPKMLLGSYVTGMIYGSEIPEAVAIPREHLRENDTVWVMNGQGRLEIREVEVLWRGKADVITAGGLSDGEWIVTSNLSAPVEGMKIRTDGASPVASGDEPGNELDSVVKADRTERQNSQAD